MAGETPGQTIPYAYKPTKKDFDIAVITISLMYRQYHHILSHEQLSTDEIDRILDGVKHKLYQLEELKLKK